MRTYLIAVFAVLALVMAACTGDEEATPDPSPTGTLDLGLSPPVSPPRSPEASPVSPPRSPEGSPVATGSPDASPGATGSPGMTDEASPSPGTGSRDGTTALTCEDAFDEVPDLSRIDSLRQFQDAVAALDATIEACDSADEWSEQADEQLAFGNLELDAEEFLRDRCEESTRLADSPICEEL